MFIDEFTRNQYRFTPPLSSIGSLLNHLARAGVVIPIPVIKQVRLIILVFGGEPEGIGLGHGAGGAEDFTEGAVFVLGGRLFRQGI